MGLPLKNFVTVIAMVALVGCAVHKHDEVQSAPVKIRTCFEMSLTPDGRVWDRPLLP
jgi:type IV pilus biogenesis protein CpaD/CtpE